MRQRQKVQLAEWIMEHVQIELLNHERPDRSPVNEPSQANPDQSCLQHNGDKKVVDDLRLQVSHSCRCSRCGLLIAIPGDPMGTYPATLSGMLFFRFIEVR